MELDPELPLLWIDVIEKDARAPNQFDVEGGEHSPALHHWQLERPYAHPQGEVSH